MLVLGYYKEFKFVLSKTNCQFFYKENSVNLYISHMINRRSVLITFSVFSSLKLNLNFTEALFQKSKINSHVVYVTK